MDIDNAISLWIGRLKSGDEDATALIFDKYFPRLVGLARKRMRDMPLAERGEEDVALSAMATFFRRAKNGEFPEMADRDDLWKLLFTITICKALAERRRRLALKRGTGKVRNEAGLNGPDDEAAGLDQLMGAWPTPQDEVQFEEVFRNVCDQLGDDQLRQILAHRLEGYNNREISQQLDVPLRSVERKVQLIRDKLEPLFQETQDP